MEFDLNFAQQGMTSLELAAERERIQQRTKEIQLRLERDKQEAFRKQERERTLTIGVERGGSASPAPTTAPTTPQSPPVPPAPTVEPR
jgi:hypothetical protein